MFTDSEIRALFERVLNRMLRAGWVHHFTFTEGKGWHINWIGDGIERACLLKQISISLRLNMDDRAPLFFDILAHGERLPETAPVDHNYRVDPTIAQYWSQSIDQLGLHGDEDGLLVMVQIVIGWAPDLNTPLKILSD